MEVDVIIPTYKPGKDLITIIERLEEQTFPVNRIILMNTEEKYFEDLALEKNLSQKHRIPEVYHLSRREFDHGGTRRTGVAKSRTPVFVMMTQDAIPADEFLIERLVTALEQDRVAVAYARQLPGADCNPLEIYGRKFNYPEQSEVKTMADLGEMGVKTYFCSNVCAAYRRDIYDEIGGFVRRTIFNEDMIFAAGAIKAGYGVAYAADACVIHSHNYSAVRQFHRNFDNGVSQAQHPEVFSGIRSESEGMKYVLGSAKYLWTEGMKRLEPSLFIQTVFKYAGFLLGKHYRMLPLFLVRKFSDNKDYWT